ncbi:T9SS type A sorting domain-containing protein [Olleya sp. YS]|uniref:T9SS type A sorting domain-containing protein n=1 Tax=Olleya sp. YS TaxID=3028318 RepID=UPI0024341D64|nr:T9SS type A sorting domain-containing protein [Olleya sp. YS]WGD35550.1 T9SS type A sorting domain-containing protein [Olleya sp. YS]
MKKLYFLFFTISAFCSAQTTLLPGEVMITGYYGDGAPGGVTNCNEAFSFVSFVDLLPGTEIRFSEEDYNQWGGSATEGDLVWLNNTGSIILAELNINIVTHSETASCGSPLSASVGVATFEGIGTWSLGTSNEEIIVFQGPAAQTLGTAISVFLTDNPSDATNTPPSLLGGPYIINFEGVDDDVDVAVYSGPTAFTDFNDFVAQLTNVASNWTTQDGAGDNGADGIAPEYPADLPVFDATLTVLDFNNDTLFTYYPNPVNDKLNLKSKNYISSVVVFNMLGQTVYKNSPNTLNSDVDMSNLKPGAYIIQVTVNETKKSIRIIKN